MAKAKIKLPTLAECEAVAGPAAGWASRCHEIACKINRDLGLNWFERYGIYTGPISPKSPFAARKFARHGWLEVPDGRIFDPTRFVFEAVEPYLYVGRDYGQYDLGGERFRSCRRPWLPPPFEPTDAAFDFTLSDADAEEYMRDLFPTYPQLSFNQLIWLGNLGPSELGESARPIYQKLIDLGQRAIVPLDYRVAVLNNGRY